MEVVEQEEEEGAEVKATITVEMARRRNKATVPTEGNLCSAQQKNTKQ